MNVAANHCVSISYEQQYLIVLHLIILDLRQAEREERKREKRERERERERERGGVSNYSQTACIDSHRLLFLDRRPG